MTSPLTKGLLSKCRHIGNGVPTHEFERHTNAWCIAKMTLSQRCSVYPVSESGPVLITIGNSKGSDVTPFFLPPRGCNLQDERHHRVAKFLALSSVYLI